MYGRKHQRGVNWITAVTMAVFHIGAIAALLHVDTGAIAVAILLWIASGMLGIGMGYHRLLTHRSYKTYKWLEYFLTTCGTLALEGGPIFWVATHRVHHVKSDREGDPHTPREGAWWAHMGWIIAGDGLHSKAMVFEPYAPEVFRDRVHAWLSTWHWVPQVVVGLALLAFGGIPYVLWGIFFRHAHPGSARHGLAWYELDLNWMTIRTLQWLGLAWDVKRAALAGPESS